MNKRQSTYAQEQTRVFCDCTIPSQTWNEYYDTSNTNCNVEKSCQIFIWNFFSLCYLIDLFDSFYALGFEISMCKFSQYQEKCCNHLFPIWWKFQCQLLKHQATTRDKNSQNNFIFCICSIRIELTENITLKKKTTNLAKLNPISAILLGTFYGSNLNFSTSLALGVH